MRMSRGSSSKLASWLWRAPRRALCRARDLYVRSITGCAGHLPPDAAFGYPTFAAAAQPPRCESFASSRSRSRSRRSYDGDDDDLRELIRAASQRRVAEAAAAAAAAEPTTVPRSQSVAMARIDEDRPCEFAGAGADVVLLRSRSCAVGAASRLGGRRGRVAAVA